jgi:uncharacterized protein (UPF0147 family)
MLLKVSRQSIQKLFFLLALQCYAVSTFAAGNAWLRLQSPRFGIVSQLSEKETRVWAEEFDKFVTALHQLYNTDDKNLLPLTIVLFKSRKQFSPYRNRTESGQAKNVVGLFANLDDWSIIGLPGLRDYQKTRRVILHEAVHWYINSQKFDPPLWLEEGIAEVFSTFEVKNGKGRWGLPIQSHIDYLDIRSLQPTREFLLASQDEALHELDTYYPQAWAMVHYFMFGNRGKNREKFSVFLSELGKKSTEKAFESAFGITYEEFDRDLRLYVRNGKYGIGEMELTNTNTEMEVGPASDAMVQLALGRMAVAGGDFDKGMQHAEAVISSLPSRPEGYELLAMASRSPENKTKQLEALEKAISLNSSDSQIYFMQAAILQEENWRKAFKLDEALEKDVARHVADMYKKSIFLRPTNKSAFEGFAVALLNLNTYEEEDRQILELGRRLYPQEGSILVGFAALARMDRNIDSFNQNLEESYGDSMRLPMNLKIDLRGMQQYTYHEWLLKQLQPLIQEGRFEEAEALLERQNSLSFISRDLHKVLDKIDDILYSSKRLYTADLAIKARKFDEATAILEDIENDEKIPQQAKSAARRMLSNIEKIKSYFDEKKVKP